MSDPEQEISVSSEGVTLKGDVVRDVSPVVRRVAETADRVLRLFDNLVGLPLDFVSNNLERFRTKYIERFEEIPLERRCEPPMRIGCAVLTKAAYSADEPDIQELFANLLASASDTQKVGLVHPSFATVIGEMLSLEAQLLLEFSRGPRRINLNAIRGTFEKHDVNRAVSNLVRLGLLDWQDKTYSKDELQKFVGRASYPSVRPEQVGTLIVPLVQDVQALKKQLIEDLQGQHLRRHLVVTAYGRNFVAAVTSFE